MDTGIHLGLSLGPTLEPQNEVSFCPIAILTQHIYYSAEQFFPNNFTCCSCSVPNLNSDHPVFRTCKLENMPAPTEIQNYENGLNNANSM